MDEVVAVLRDPARAKTIIDNAYHEIALNPSYSFRSMVSEFDRDLAVEFDRRLSKRRFVARLVSYQRRSTNLFMLRHGAQGPLRHLVGSRQFLATGWRLIRDPKQGLDRIVTVAKQCLESASRAVQESKKSLELFVASTRRFLASAFLALREPKRSARSIARRAFDAVVPARYRSAVLDRIRSRQPGDSKSP
jgi:hypothetical protein